MLLKRYDRRVGVLTEVRVAGLVRAIWRGIRDVQAELPVRDVVEIERLEVLCRLQVDPTPDELAHWEWWVTQLHAHGAAQAVVALERLVSVEDATRRINAYMDDLRSRESAGLLNPEELLLVGATSRSNRWIRQLPTCEVEQLAHFDQRTGERAAWEAFAALVDDILTRYPDLGDESPWHASASPA